MTALALLLTLTLRLLMASLVAEAQPQTGKMPVVGALNTGAPTGGNWLPALRLGLQELGYVEGQTIALELRHAEGRPEALPRLAAELVHLKVDVLVAIGPAAVRAANDATGSIPIVALDFESDPVQSGLVCSFAQPSGNITGLFADLPGLTGKWLELMREVVPGLTRVAVLWDPTTGPYQVDALRAVAHGLQIDPQVVAIKDPDHYGPILTTAVETQPEALIMLSSPLLSDARYLKPIADFTVQHHLPAISLFKRFAEVGGLIAYGPETAAQTLFMGRLAVYVDKILKGAKPADVPLERPTKFELVINLKTARALGLTIPPTLLIQANEVIR